MLFKQTVCLTDQFAIDGDRGESFRVAEIPLVIRGDKVTQFNNKYIMFLYIVSIAQALIE